MSKSKGFKALHFKDRSHVMKALKGVNLSVWLHHYWRTNAGNVEVMISIPELVDALPYSERHIEHSRSWLVKNGWLIRLNPAQKDSKGMWSVPVYGVSFEGIQAPHAAHPRKKKIKADGVQQGGESQHPSDDDSRAVKITAPSSGENPRAENHRSMNKPFKEELTGSPSLRSGEVEKEVSESVSEVASLPSTSDASHHTDKINPIGKQRGKDEAYYVGQALYSIGLRPKETILSQIFETHPDFVWNSETCGAAKRILGTKYWKSHVKTLENFRHYWSKSGGKCLHAQILRELPDEPPAAEDVYPCWFCKTPLNPGYRGIIASTLDTCCFQCAQAQGEKFEGFVPKPLEEVRCYLEGEINMCEVWCKLPEGHDGGCAGTAPKFVTEGV